GGGRRARDPRPRVRSPGFPPRLWRRLLRPVRPPHAPGRPPRRHLLLLPDRGRRPTRRRRRAGRPDRHAGRPRRRRALITPSPDLNDESTTLYTGPSENPEEESQVAEEEAIKTAFHDVTEELGGSHTADGGWMW